MVWAWNLVCGRFINFRNGRKILTLLTFGCPSYETWLPNITEIAPLALLAGSAPVPAVVTAISVSRWIKAARQQHTNLYIFQTALTQKVLQFDSHEFLKCVTFRQSYQLDQNQKNTYGLVQRGPTTFDQRPILQKRDNSRATSNNRAADSQDLKFKRDDLWVKGVCHWKYDKAAANNLLQIAISVMPVAEASLALSFLLTIPLYLW